MIDAKVVSVAECKELFINQIVFQAAWRKGKALEYERNNQSAACLRKLAQSLTELPENDLTWSRVQRAWPRDDDGVRLCEFESETLGTYGFGYEPADGGDAAKFLDADLGTLEEELGVTAPPPKLVS
jgi:hypothetical protein